MLRDVKATLGMERFDVRMPEMASSTLWMMTIACNLLRSLMQRSAIVAGKPVSHMSFKGILDHAVASRESYLAHRGKPRRLAAHHDCVVESCAEKVIGIRPFRREPWAIKRRPKVYPMLTSLRKVFKETLTGPSTLGGIGAKLRAIPDSRSLGTPLQGFTATGSGDAKHLCAAFPLLSPPFIAVSTHG